MLRAASILIVASLLGACSANDVLTLDPTPPAAVGNAPAQYAATPVAAAPQPGVDRSNLAPPTVYNTSQQTYPAAPPASVPATSVAQASPAYDATPGIGRAPSTFGAQAAGLAPAQPVNPAPVRQQPAAPAAMPPLAAPVSQPPVAQPPASQPPAPQPPATQEPSATASVATAETIRFLPIIGAPSDKLQPLSARLGDSARAAGLSIVAMDDAAADLSLKGYFSAVDQDGVVSVIYVWDVIGANGVRLHRIQDREAATTGGFSGDDPWAGVSPDMMATIGQKSIGALLGWLDTQG